MLYFDTSYLVRLYLDDAGCERVRVLGGAERGRFLLARQAEILCSLHRALREGRLNAEAYQAQRDQFHSDHEAEACNWLPLTDATLARLDRILSTAPASTFLRSADALHLACAAENGF